MNSGLISLREDYWANFSIEKVDIEFLYNHLLEKETPLTSTELTHALVQERVRRERINIERQRSAGGSIFVPKETYAVDQTVVFPALSWRLGQVAGLRSGYNPELG